MEKIKDGNFIIIQRGNYLRIQKFSAKKPTIKLGKESGNRPRLIDFSSIEGNNYESLFKMVPDEKHEHGWRLEIILDNQEVEEFYKGNAIKKNTILIFSIYLKIIVNSIFAIFLFKR